MNDQVQVSDATPKGGETPATLDDIADTLISAPAPEEEQKKAQPEPTPEPRAVPDTAQATADEPDDAVTEPADPEPQTEDPEPVEAKADDDGEYDFLDIFDEEATPADPQIEDDGRTYRVKVDGEEVEVGINDLLKNYSAEGAVQKRLQEATHARTEATESAQRLVEEARQMHERIATVYNHYNEVLFAPRVQQPDPAIRETDPIGYMQQMEDFRQDQDRIQQERGQIEQVLGAASQQMQEQRKAFAQSEATKLREKIPKLNDAKARQSFKREIVEIGRAHGFSDAEITDTADHRLLTMAAEAAAYRRLKARMQAKPTTELKVRKTPMSPTAPKRGGPKARAAQQQRRARERAQQSGSVDDIAATLIV